MPSEALIAAGGIAAGGVSSDLLDLEGDDLALPQGKQGELQLLPEVSR